MVSSVTQTRGNSANPKAGCPTSTNPTSTCAAQCCRQSLSASSPAKKTSPMPQKPLHPCPPASSSQDAGSQKSPALGTSAALSAQEEPGNCSCGRNDAAEVLRRPRGHRMVSKGVMPHGWCAQGQEQVQHSTVQLRGTCGLWLSCIVSTRPQRSPSSALDVNKHIQPHG